MHHPRQLASDTWAGLCPEAIRAMQEANQDHASAYGDDSWTQRAVSRLRELFETDCEVFFVASGTAANALALAAMCQSYHAVICHADAHIQTDECGAPEYLAGGIKLMNVANPNGKLDPDAIRRTAAKRRDVHSNKPHVVSISQATEVGTLYSVEEMAAIGETARDLGLRLHMDGARFANAIATLDVAPKAITWQAGVDVLCFGGAKNGIALGDAIIFFNREAAADFEYRRKQAGHLISKMRFITAPWATALESGIWLRNARQANAMARKLEQELRAIPSLRILYPVQANGVFLTMPPSINHALHERGWHFYTIADGERLMCSWDTQAQDIEAFVRDLKFTAEKA